MNESSSSFIFSKPHFFSLKLFSTILYLQIDRYLEENIMECKQELNLESCTCGADGCLRHHLSHRQFSSCVFPADLEIKDRSLEAFARMVAAGPV
jgi:hypothetical protein